jgi:hypothetical protein
MTLYRTYRFAVRPGKAGAIGSLLDSNRAQNCDDLTAPLKLSPSAIVGLGTNRSAFGQCDQALHCTLGSMDGLPGFSYA